MAEGVKILQYADDLVIFSTEKNLDTCRTKIQQSLINLENWMDEHDMELSVPKTKPVIFSKGRRYPQEYIKYKGEAIDYESTYKYLCHL